MKPIRTRGSIVIAGSLAQKSQQGGHTWQFLQYLLGFRRLGWDVLFLDRLEPSMCRDESGCPCPVEKSVNLRYFLEVMDAFGLSGAYSLSYDRDAQRFGLPKQAVIERTKRAAFLLNVMGFLDDDEILACAARRVFLDTDPGFGQMWCDLGWADLFRGHDEFVTIAENIGRADCTIPTCGRAWKTWRQPVLLDDWQADASSANWFASIGSWRGPYDSIQYQNRTYGLRAHEFRKFASLPRITGRRFRVALDIDQADRRDLKTLAKECWTLVDPKVVTSDPFTYRQFVHASAAEFMVAKGMYVDSRGGWMSERSICYLASGRPVLAQDTGLAGLYPTGRGLLTFQTLDEAAAGAEEIFGNYHTHARAARELAGAYFDSDKVLAQLLDQLDVR